MMSFFGQILLTIIRPVLLVWVFMWVQTGNNAFPTSLEKAQEYYKKVVQFAIPEQTIGYYNLGNTYYKQGAYEQAQEAYTKALAKANKEQEALIYYNLGNIHYRLGEAQLKQDTEATIRYWDSAIEHYEEALVRNPKDKQAQENIEFIKKRLNELEKKAQSQSNSSEGEKQQQQDQSFEDDKERIEKQEQDEIENYKSYKKYYRDKEGSNKDKSQPYW